jgi:DNA-binding NarL/FixJ family response regulator
MMIFGNPIRVLLIDGYHQDREYYSRELKASRRSYVILEAASGQSGIKLFLSHSIDCVIMEIELPDMSGFEVLTKLVPAVQHPQVAVVMLTRFGNSAFLDLAMKNGAQIGLRKGDTSGELLDRAIQTSIASVHSDRAVERAGTSA